MNNHASRNAHAVLHLLVSKALLEGTIGTSEVYIPLTELGDPLEGLKLSADAADVVLRVTISTSWEDADLVEELIEHNFEPDLDQEEEHEEPIPRSPDKNKKSH